MIEFTKYSYIFNILISLHQMMQIYQYPYEDKMQARSLLEYCMEQF